MTVGVNHSWHKDATSCVDLHCIVWNSELSPDSRNAIGSHENIPILDNAQRRVNGQHGGIAEYDWPARGKRLIVCCKILAHITHLIVSWPQEARLTYPCLLSYQRPARQACLHPGRRVAIHSV